MKPLNLVALKAQYDLITATLKANDGNMSKTAKLLRIDRKTVYNKIEKYNRHKKAIEASASS